MTKSRKLSKKRLESIKLQTFGIYLTVNQYKGTTYKTFAKLVAKQEKRPVAWIGTDCWRLIMSFVVTPYREGRRIEVERWIHQWEIHHFSTPYRYSEYKKPDWMQCAFEEYDRVGPGNATRRFQATASNHLDMLRGRKFRTASIAYLISRKF